ncbi:MAG: radical SAM protein [Deltaproteobacteria bacterium]|nr:radical SAM protein [Deltaproteobacteria bacterium]
MARSRTVTAAERNTPRYVVWELTTLCDHACGHCGSRARTARDNELALAETLAIADQLVALGTKEVTLIGGEAYLWEGLTELVAYLTRLGIRTSIQTGGWGVTPELARELASAGLRGMGFSVDGTEAVHDALRAKVGSHAAVLRAISAARSAGLNIAANTQINRLTAAVLPQTARLLFDAGVRVWRGQLTVPMGRAADTPDVLLQPWQILDVLDTLGGLQMAFAEEASAQGLGPDDMFNIVAGNNLGYYSPHELILRSDPGGTARHWTGCQAGVYTMSIESDGTIKACPSLPTAPYVGGNVRDVTLEEVWSTEPALNFVQNRDRSELWGFCGTCAYGETCGAGCSFTTHCTMGRRGNNPYCYHRAKTLAAEGRRERLVQVLGAIGTRYDFGRFEVVLEPLP